MLSFKFWNYSHFIRNKSIIIKSFFFLVLPRQQIRLGESDTYQLSSVAFVSFGCSGPNEIVLCFIFWLVCLWASIFGLTKSTHKSRNVSTISFFDDGFFISWNRTNYNGGSGISVSISLPVVASSIHLPICFVIKCSIAIKSLLNSLDPRKP